MPEATNPAPEGGICTQNAPAWKAISACPRWQRCSANICPLDPEWEQRTHGAGDTICFYLLEAVKTGSEQRFQANATGEMRQRVLGPLPALMSRWAAIRSAVDRAKTTGSRMDRPQPQKRAA